MKKHLLLFLIGECLFLVAVCQNDLVSVKQNPKLDANLSPARNQRINPKFNTSINPAFNWNYNPAENPGINPDSTTSINPKDNPGLNPKQSEALNPMLNYTLHPGSGTWRGRYLFDSTDNLVAFITVASQNILLCFDKQGKWTCYFVKTAKGTYNQFQLNGEWTGKFLCPDSLEGFNLFNKEGVWTGNHVK